MDETVEYNECANDIANHAASPWVARTSLGSRGQEMRKQDLEGAAPTEPSNFQVYFYA